MKTNERSFWVRILDATEAGVCVADVSVQCQEEGCDEECSNKEDSATPLDEAVANCLNENGWSHDTIFCPSCQEQSDRIDSEEALAEARHEAEIDRAMERSMEQ